MIKKAFFPMLCCLFIQNSLFINANTPLFRLGLENINENTVKQINLNKDKVGLITNQTGVDQNKNRNIDILKKYFNLDVIFVPEHGLAGKTHAGNDVGNTVDTRTDIKVISLYKSGGFKAPNKEELKDIYSLIFDIQDSGMRHYTYISTLYRILEAAGKYNKRVIVLDRPNPLGSSMEGPLVEPGLESFISIAPIPLRHGMTIGELARYFNKHLLEDKVHLTIIPMTNYDRTIGIEGDLLVPLSPNINTINSCYGYSFLGLLGEIKPFNVGVGTQKSFQCVLIPSKIKFSSTKWKTFKEILDKFDVEYDKKIFRSKKRSKKYKGLALKFKDISNFQSTNTLISLLDFFKRCGIKYSYAGSFDKATGTKDFKKLIEGKISRWRFAKQVNSDLNDFYKKASSCFIYNPNPKIVKIA